MVFSPENLNQMRRMEPYAARGSKMAFKEACYCSIFFS